MPSHKIHKYVDRLLLGKSYPKVHEAIDRPFLILGRKHRSLFHTPNEAYVIGTLASTDRWGGLAGLLHLKVDKICSQNKELRRFLKLTAKQDEKWRKDMRRFKERLKKR